MTTTPLQTRAQEIYAEAAQYLVGGVTAGARATTLLDTPFFAERAAGSRITDVDGRTYLDLHTSFGAALLGHGHPCITAAVQDALARGILCAFEVEASSQAARKLVEMVPCAEKVRFSATGTETTYQVLKLARAVTGKHLVLKFEGHFHGFNDYVQYNYWPPRGAGLPELYVESAGALDEMAGHVYVLPFNDTAALERTVKARKHELAAVILEPVNFNGGGIRPRPDFLEALRTLTAANDILLIFDEILSGFRTGPGCMQAYLGVTPDLCTLGKAIGGGLPLSAIAGRARIMDGFTPVGKVAQTGTYLAHPTAIFACNAFLDEIARPGFWPALLGRSERLYAGLREIIARRGVKCLVQATGARFCLLFGLETEPENYRMVVEARDVAQNNRFVRLALEAGLFVWTGYHHGISASHTDADVDEILERFDTVIGRLA